MIRLFWAKCNNFGDELSPYIISKLSGDTVVYRRNFTLRQFMKDFISFFKTLIIKGRVDSFRLKYSFFNKVILGIGSIINESTSLCLVWGSGIVSRDTVIKDGNFKAVRGEYTRKRLIELGFSPPKEVGDPALLLPLIYTPKKKEKIFMLGIIPHKMDFQEIKLKYSNDDNICVIDLMNNNIEVVIDEIYSCKYIVSTSLHGLIVSHAYNIPALYFEYGKLIGDGVKFYDYFSSVRIKEYLPFSIQDFEFTKEGIMRLFIENKSVSYIQNDLFSIQKGLLKAAPFNIPQIKIILENEIENQL